MKQRRLKERQQATSYQPGQFENALHEERVQNTPTTTPMAGYVHDYSFNLTGIVTPQPPRWKQADHLYEDFKKF